jgi:hypothetical protein
MTDEPVAQNNLPECDPGAHSLQMTGQGFRRRTKQVAQRQRQRGRLPLRGHAVLRLARLLRAVEFADIGLLPRIHAGAGRRRVFDQDRRVALGTLAVGLRAFGFEFHRPPLAFAEMNFRLTIQACRRHGITPKDSGFHLACERAMVYTHRNTRPFKRAVLVLLPKHTPVL